MPTSTPYVREPGVSCSARSPALIAPAPSVVSRKVKPAINRRFDHLPTSRCLDLRPSFRCRCAQSGYPTLSRSSWCSKVVIGSRIVSVVSHHFEVACFGFCVAHGRRFRSHSHADGSCLNPAEYSVFTKIRCRREVPGRHANAWDMHCAQPRSTPDGRCIRDENPRSGVDGGEHSATLDGVMAGCQCSLLIRGQVRGTNTPAITRTSPHTPVAHTIADTTHFSRTVTQHAMM